MPMQHAHRHMLASFMHPWEMVSRGVREKRDKKDLQREKKSDSWRNTDTQKEKQRKLESGDGRHTQPLAKQHGAESHTLTDTPTDTQIDRQTDGRTDDPTDKTRKREENGQKPEDRSQPQDRWMYGGDEELTYQSQDTTMQMLIQPTECTRSTKVLKQTNKT